MRYDRLYTKLFCQPVLLESAYRVGLELALISLSHGKVEEASSLFSPSLRKVDEERQVRRSDQILEVRGDTAVIHVDGAIDKNLSAMDRLCFDAADLNDIDNAISRVANDRTIRNVLFAINSPGGSFPGVPETAGRIAALSDSKNTIAWCGDMACSAAYWLACQCDQIIAPSSASVGSIGVYLALLDRSRQMEDMGVKVTEIKDGALKTAGAPWKPLSETEAAHLQDRVNQIGAMFRAAVTDGRGDVDPDHMQGQSFLGPAALQAGLIDAIRPTMEAALAEF